MHPLVQPRASGVIAERGVQDEEIERLCQMADALPTALNAPQLEIQQYSNKRLKAPAKPKDPKTMYEITNTHVAQIDRFFHRIIARLYSSIDDWSWRFKQEVFCPKRPCGGLAMTELNEQFDMPSGFTCQVSGANNFQTYCAS